MHGDVAYFSAPDSGSIFSYKLPDNKWIKLPNLKYYCFALAVVNDKLTTVGGTTNLHDCNAATNALVSLSSTVGFFARKWSAAVVTAGNYLVVAGGEKEIKEKLIVVEVLKIDLLQWFGASSLPQPLSYPQMKICNACCYICADNTIFSCSVDALLKTAQLTPTNGFLSSVWTRRANIPVQYAPGLVAVQEELLSIGGKDNKDVPTGAVYQFNPTGESWNLIGWMPTPRSHALAVALSNNEVVVVGGVYGDPSVTTEIAIVV